MPSILDLQGLLEAAARMAVGGNCISVLSVVGSMEAARASGQTPSSAGLQTPSSKGEEAAARMAVGGRCISVLSVVNA
jgi:hypothetical protein